MRRCGEGWLGRLRKAAQGGEARALLFLWYIARSGFGNESVHQELVHFGFAQRNTLGTANQAEPRFCSETMTSSGALSPSKVSFAWRTD